MNINLLPDKFIKNRASFILLTISGTLFLSVSIVLIIFYGIVNFQLKESIQQQQLKQADKIVYTNKIADLKKSQSVDVKNVVTNIKNKQYLVEDLVVSMERDLKKSEHTGLNYKIQFPNALAGLGETNLEEEQSSLSFVLDILGPNLAGLGETIERLEESKWIQHVELLESNIETAIIAKGYKSSLKIAIEPDNLPVRENISEVSKDD